MNNIGENQIELLKKILDEKTSKGDDFLLEDYDAYKKIVGASDSEINNMEKIFEVTVEEEFKNFYRYKNGSEYFPVFFVNNEGYGRRELFYSIDVEKIIDLKRKKNCPMDSVYVKEEIDKLDKRIKPFLENSKWLPFAISRTSSSTLFIDYDPTPEGEPGQIICFVHDPDFYYYVSNNFKEMLIESNEYFSKIEDINDHIL